MKHQHHNRVTLSHSDTTELYREAEDTTEDIMDPSEDNLVNKDAEHRIPNIESYRDENVHKVKVENVGNTIIRLVKVTLFAR